MLSYFNKVFSFFVQLYYLPKWLLCVGWASLLWCGSCATPSSSNTSPQKSAKEVKAVNLQVKVVKVEKRPFRVEMLSNGKILAGEKSRLQFQQSGVIEKMMVSNGSLVSKGQLIASLNSEYQQVALQQAQYQVQKAEEILNRLVLEFGGNDRDTNSVKPRLLRDLKIRAGYYDAIANLKLAQLNYDKTILLAPFSGIIADLTLHRFNHVSQGEAICTLLSTHNRLAEAYLLETELRAVAINQPARIILGTLEPKTYQGYVSTVNPIINEEGLAKVQVQVNQPDLALVEGMSVQVIFDSFIPNQVVVPKRAIVDRSGKKIIFTYSAGRAKWNEVKILYENSEEMAVEGIAPEDQIIVEGQLNLAPDAAVELAE